MLLAEEAGKIVGVFRGCVGRMGSLIVHMQFYSRAIRKSLAEEFEDQIRGRGRKYNKVSSSINRTGLNKDGL
jgi:hypothetical protein